MADVAFHTGVRDEIPYACRLLRKAYRSGARVAVYGPPAVLERLGQALWRLDPQDFLPHLVLPRAGLAAGQLDRTPILLMKDGQLPQGSQAMVGVSLDAPEPLPVEAFGRIIEIVADMPDQRQAARQRWRQYEQAGAKPVHLAAPPA